MIGGGVGVIQFNNERFNPETPVVLPVTGFNDGQRFRTVIIPHGDRFAINLMSGSENLFHFNVRFDERAIVRNSTSGGAWQQEERWSDSFPFKHGRAYTFELLCRNGMVVVILNGEELTTFFERDPHSSVDRIEIEGDCHVHSTHVSH